MSFGENVVNRVPTWYLQLILGTLIVGVVGCQQPPKPIQFSNMIAKTNQKLSEGAKKFYKAIEPLKAGAPADTSSMQSAYNEISSTLRDAREQFSKISPPFNSEKGPDLLEKYQNFLTSQQTIFDSCITPMQRIVQDNATYPDPGAKWVAIFPLLGRATQEEATAMAALKKSHEDYCKSHVLEPK